MKMLLIKNLKLTICCVTLCLQLLAAFAAIADDSVLKSGKQVYLSPDRALRAIVIHRKLRGDDHAESRVEIRSKNGHLVAQSDYTSDSGTSGYRIGKAAWTANSHCFVYSTSNSAGHAPWHHPMFFYSRRRHRFYSIDLCLEHVTEGIVYGAVTGGLTLKKPCTIITYGRCPVNNPAITKRQDNSGGDELLIIDLCRLEHTLTTAYEDHRFRF